MLTDQRDYSLLAAQTLKRGKAAVLDCRRTLHLFDA
jgi:hypothetical protein